MPPSLPPKICPECGEEYLHSAERCVHCEVVLVHAGELPGDGAAQELPPIAELCCVRAASSSWARNLSALLRDAGIAHRIEAVGGEGMGSARRPGHELPCGVYVRAEDLAAASEIDALHLASEIPDLPEGFALDAGSGDDACPACGAALDPAAEECGDCGLALGPGG